jgi:hypothetical protein
MDEHCGEIFLGENFHFKVLGFNLEAKKTRSDECHGKQACSLSQRG